MKRTGMLRFAAILTAVCLVAGPVALVAGAPEGRFALRSVQGTWSSLIEIPPNDVLGNPVPMYMSELESFTGAGAVISSFIAPLMPLNTDAYSGFVAVEIAQGNWAFRDGHYAMTTWRFITDTATGNPLGYVKITSEWSLLNRNQGEGSYLVEIVHPDMSTPHELDGVPIELAGTLEMWRLPVESLP